MKQFLFLLAVYALIYNQSNKKNIADDLKENKEININSIPQKNFPPYIPNYSGTMITRFITYQNVLYGNDFQWK